MLVIFVTEICCSSSQALGNQECSILFPFEKSFDLTKQIFTDHTCCVNVIHFVQADVIFSNSFKQL